MKRIALVAGATIAIGMTSALAATRGTPQEEVLMPEVSVRGQAVDRQHPQDGIYAERPLGCVEVVTPSGTTGSEVGGYFLARNAPEGIPVIPSLNDPTSASDNHQRGTAVYHQSEKTPVGQEGKPGCNR
ncbi:MAG TPA: hypothetical protein VHP37_17795 [Burkholderiales bacterium]|nr:hypothetical protein [Burkholderiales bacterium]